MDGHLVTVEVSIEGMTYERMKLEGLSINKNRLKGLNAESVQRRSTVEHDRMLFHDLVQDCPYLRCLLLDKGLCPLDVEGDVLLDKLAHDEWLEQLKSHL